MEFIKRRVVACVMLLAMGMASLPAKAEELNDDQINDRPTALAMFGDMIFARPLLLAGTVIGTTLYVVTLPFTVMGGNMKEAAKTLVVGPAHATFVRCLGCTETQDEWKNKQQAVNETSTASK